MPAWVVAPGRVCLRSVRWFAEHDVPVGGYLTIRRTDVPGRVEINYARRSRALSGSGPLLLRITAALRGSQTLHCSDHDDLMIIDVEDPDAIDALWMRVTERNTPLETIMEDLLRQLAPLSQQGMFMPRRCIVP